MCLHKDGVPVPRGANRTTSGRAKDDFVEERWRNAAQPVRLVVLSDQVVPSGPVTLEAAKQ